MKNKKVLLTGSSGFIGNRILHKLKKLNCEILCILRGSDNLSVGDKNKKIKKIKWDLSRKGKNQFNVKAKLKGITHVLHLASLIPRGKKEDAVFYYEQNLMNTINLVSALPESVRWFCYASTIDVYGIPSKLPLTEESTLKPYTHYAASKAATENFLKIYCQQNKIKLVILRLTQVYGPKDKSGKLIASCIKTVLEGQPLIIRGDGKDERDYVYVDDAAAAFTNALKRQSEGIFNIATGTSYKIIEVVKKIKHLSGLNFPITFAPSTKAMYKLKLDVRAAKKELLLRKPETLDVGLKKTILWEKNK